MRQSHKYLVWAGIGMLAVATAVTFSQAQAPPPASLPDMEVYSIMAPSSATRGAVISVSDVTTNIGTANGAQSITGYYMCQSLTGVSGGCFVTNHTTAGVAKGKSWSWSGSLTVRSNQALGTNYLVVVCNYTKVLAESNYANNTNHVIIVIN